MKRKKGTCSECGEPDRWLGRVKPPQCISCYEFLKAKEYTERQRKKREEEKAAGKVKKPKKIKPMSAKRKKELEEYERVRDIYMAEHKTCEVKGCFREANDLHHKAGRIGSLLTDINYFMAVCRGCHDKIHENPKWAESKGYIIRVREIKGKF